MRLTTFTASSPSGLVIVSSPTTTEAAPVVARVCIWRPAADGFPFGPPSDAPTEAELVELFELDRRSTRPQKPQRPFFGPARVRALDLRAAMLHEHVLVARTHAPPRSALSEQQRVRLSEGVREAA